MSANMPAKRSKHVAHAAKQASGQRCHLVMMAATDQIAPPALQAGCHVLCEGPVTQQLLLPRSYARPRPSALQGLKLDCSCCSPVSIRCLPPAEVGNTAGLPRLPVASSTFSAAGRAAPWILPAGCCSPTRVHKCPTAACLPLRPTGTALAWDGPAGKEEHVGTACGSKQVYLDTWQGASCLGLACRTMAK